MQYMLPFRVTVRACVRARARGSSLRHFAAVMTASPGDSSGI